MTQNILIIGATSGIAEAVARRYASQSAQLFLVGRNSDKLKVIAGDLLARGACNVETFVMDVNDYAKMPVMLESVWNNLGNIDVALIAHGTLPDQMRAQVDSEYAIAEFRNNAEGIIVCLTELATRFEAQGNGVIAVIGSVAGDRGRASNYVYGAAKAAVHAFASGLRVRLFKSGVHVLTIKPGFVDTPMTKDLALPQALVVTSDKVAVDIIKAITKKQNVLYTPWFWYWIMLIIRHIPIFIFKKTNL
jgi:decaprenylphospho-beta-D-erythro-pentofuranosid-2-ulose 2-reductase